MSELNGINLKHKFAVRQLELDDQPDYWESVNFLVVADSIEEAEKTSSKNGALKIFSQNEYMKREK